MNTRRKLLTLAVSALAAAPATAALLDPSPFKARDYFAKGIFEPDGPNPYKELAEALRKDPDAAWGFHCNLSVAYFDEVGGSLADANRASARFMRQAFDIDITKHRWWWADRAFIGSEMTEDLQRVCGGRGGGKQMKALDSLENIRNISRSPGNVDYSPYLFGMANGIELAWSIVTGKEPEFLNKPTKWLEEVTDGPQKVPDAELRVTVKS